MAKFDALRRIEPPSSLRYAVAVLSVTVAVIAAWWMDIALQSAAHVSLFLCALMFSAWFGGIGPGLLAVTLSVLAFDYFFLPPIYSLAVTLEELPRLLLFACAALFVGSLTAAQRTAAESLARARDDLQGALQDLKKINEALQAENTERKRAENALRKSESYLAEEQKLSHTGSFGWNVSTGKIFWSEETYRIAGYDMATKPTVELILQRIHPEDRACVQENRDCASQSGSDLDFEHRFLMPDGVVKYVHVLAHAVRDKSGDLEYVGAATDVTARRHAEDERRKSEEKYRDLVDLSPDAIYVVDKESRLVSANPAGIELLQCTAQDVVGMPIAATYLPEDRALHHAPLETLMGDACLRFERTFMRKDGSQAPVEVSASAIRVGYSQVVVRDISERKRAEADLRKAQTELAHVSRVMTMGELTASIAHEVNQPLSAIVANGNACLRWMAADVPNLDEARETARRIIRDGKRASEVISRIRALVRKAGTKRAALDINDAIREFVALAQIEVRRKASPYEPSWPKICRRC